jgi:isocitrate dehydrogenase (NAD+)
MAMAHRVTLIPGDGIGPEVTTAARRVLDGTGAEIDWDVQEAGSAVAERTGDPLPTAVLDSLRANLVGLKGPLTTPARGGHRSANIALRRSLDLFAQVRPCRSAPGAPAKFSEVDLVVIRETTEDLYAGIEFEGGSSDARELVAWLAARGARVDPNAGISLKPLSEDAARRIFEFSFDWARANGREKISVVHKATVMRYTDGLFLDVGREVARGQTDVDFDDVLVDNLVGQLVRRPEQYDVLVMPNQYGDVVSDLAAGLIGGVGLAPGGNYGPDIALFEPGHGSAPRYAGLDRVNPTATILSGAMLLRYLGETDAAHAVEVAVREVISEGRVVTYDLSPTPGDASGTQEMTAAVVSKLRATTLRRPVATPQTP